MNSLLDKYSERYSNHSLKEAFDSPKGERPSGLLKMMLLIRLKQRGEIFFYSLVGVVLGGLTPYLHKLFLDDLRDISTAGSGTAYLLWAFLFALLSQFFITFSKNLGQKEGTLFQRWLQMAVYRQSLRLKNTMGGGRTVGEMVSYSAGDVSTASLVLEDFLPMLFSGLLPLVFAPIALVIIYDINVWPLLFFIALVAGVTFVMGTKQSKYFATFKNLAAKRVGVVNEWAQNIRSIRVLDRLNSVENQIIQRRIEETDNRIRMVTNGSIMNSIVQVAPLILNMITIIIVLGSLGENLRPGDLFGILWIVGLFLTKPLRSLPWYLVIFMDSFTSIKRVEKFLRDPVEDEQGKENSEVYYRKAGALRVKNLVLKIDGKPFLNKLSFDVPAGAFWAVTGKVGSGKSLLLQSLIREVPASFDEYDLDGHDAKKLDLKSVRRSFSFLPQDSFLMNASVRENITLDYDDAEKTIASTDNLTRLLEKVQLNVGEKIMLDLDTELGERGVNLSGGQKQRLLLARACHFDRPIFLLDDSLNAIDLHTEERIMEEVFLAPHALLKDRTRIFVTSNERILKQVQHIVFLENGAIVDQGTFTELKGRSSVFREFLSNIKKKEEGAHEIQL